MFALTNDFGGWKESTVMICGGLVLDTVGGCASMPAIDGSHFCRSSLRGILQRRRARPAVGLFFATDDPLTLGELA